MPNQFLTPEQVSKKILEELNKKGDEWQKLTGCSDEEKEQFKKKLLYSFTAPLFYGPTM